MTTELTVSNKGLVLRTMEDMLTWADCVIKANLAPMSFRTPEAIVVATQYGSELGLSPMQSLQSICVVKGKPTVYGRCAIGLVKNSGLCVHVKEYFEGEGDQRTAVCESLRKGEQEPMIARFSVADAKRARLWGKEGPWTQYPQRMMVYRARGFNLSDNFSDVLMGMHIAEELDGFRDVDEEYTTENMPQTQKRGDRVLDVEITRTRESALAETIAAFKAIPAITGLSEDQASVIFADFAAWVLRGSASTWANPESWTIENCDYMLEYIKVSGIPNEVLEAHIAKDDDNE